MIATATVFDHLGWTDERRSNYYQIRDYAEKFGKANLEKEDRRELAQFNKASERLQEVAKAGRIGRIGGKIDGKTHFEWKRDELKAYQQFGEVDSGYTAAWVIIKQEELFALDALRPVLSRTDTIHRHLTSEDEWSLIHKAAAENEGRGRINRHAWYDYMKGVYADQWNHSRWNNWEKELGSDAVLYPAISTLNVDSFRKECRRRMLNAVRNTFPSLAVLPEVGTPEWDKHIAQYF